MAEDEGCAIQCDIEGVSVYGVFRASSGDVLLKWTDLTSDLHVFVEFKDKL